MSIDKTNTPAAAKQSGTSRKPRRDVKSRAATPLPGLPAIQDAAVPSPAAAVKALVADTVAPAAVATPLPVEPVETPAPAAAAPAPTPPIPVVSASKETDTPSDPITSEPDQPTPPTAAVPADIEAKEVVMEATIENATNKTQAMFGEASTRTQAAMDKSARMLEDAAAFNKDNLEALVESSRIAARGFEHLGQGAADYAKRSFESTTQAWKTLASAKSPTEFMKLQSDYARTSFDTLVAETSKSTETMLKLAGEIAQPLSNRFAVAAEKMKISA